MKVLLVYLDTSEGRKAHISMDTQRLQMGIAELKVMQPDEEPIEVVVRYGPLKDYVRGNNLVPLQSGEEERYILFSE